VFVTVDIELSDSTRLALNGPFDFFCDFEVELSALDDRSVVDVVDVV
jgi:hypothetical protein